MVDNKKIKSISVFGGSQSKPGEKDYNQAIQMGKLLAMAGYAVITGGYIGAMEAVSRGAAECGGHVIGVTCDEIEDFRPVKPNRWITEERRFVSFHQRLLSIVENSDAAIALPGGPGTLAEITVMWTLLLTGAISPRLLILIGRGWKDVFLRFLRTFDVYVPENQRRWLTFANDPQQAVELLNQAFRQ